MKKSPLFLVTGGACFIGSNLVDGLLSKGFRVRVLDNLSTGKKENPGGEEGEGLLHVEAPGRCPAHFRGYYKSETPPGFPSFGSL